MVVSEIMRWLEERHFFYDKKVILSHTLNPCHFCFFVGRKIVRFRDTGLQSPF